MSNILTPSLQATALTKITKVRRLPVDGTILVKVGEQVRCDQTIAKADLLGELRILKLPEQMGLEIREVLNGLKVSEKMEVKAGDLLCEHAGLFGLLKTRFAAPDSGSIEFIAKQTGHIGLRLPAEPIQLKAYISGKVTEIQGQAAVKIETSGAYIQGIFGIGSERYGELIVIANENEILNINKLPENITGKILVGGKTPDSEFLKLAAERGAKGLVTAAINETPLKNYLGYDLGLAVTGDEDIPMTVIITEGFGNLDFSTSTLNLLKQLNGKIASINGATQVRAGAVRPEIIISHELTNVKEYQRKLPLEAGLAIGQSIRIIRVPYFGLKGEIIELPHKKQLIASGALARVLVAKLENGEVVTVPRVNVEVI